MCESGSSSIWYVSKGCLIYPLLGFCVLVSKSVIEGGDPTPLKSTKIGGTKRNATICGLKVYVFGDKLN